MGQTLIFSKSELLTLGLFSPVTLERKEEGVVSSIQHFLQCEQMNVQLLLVPRLPSAPLTQSHWTQSQWDGQQASGQSAKCAP